MECFHCHEPIIGKPWPATSGDKTVNTCCPGCQSVVNAINSLGLDNYYDIRETTNPVVSPESLQRDYSWLDKSNCIREDGELFTAILFVENMRCAACSWLINSTLSGNPGMRNCQTNLTRQTVKLSWDPKTQKLSELAEAIAALGYEVYPWDEKDRAGHLEQVRRKHLKRLVVSGLGSMQVMMLSVGLYIGEAGEMDPEHAVFLRWISFTITSVVMVYAGQPFFASAWGAIRRLRVNMDTPVSIALLAAYFASIINTSRASGDTWYDTVCMFIFFLSVSRQFEFRAMQNSNNILERTRQSIQGFFTRLSGDREETVRNEDINQGDLLLIHPGEYIPVDGEVVSGCSMVNESVLTGEFQPEQKAEADPVHAGSINGDGPLTIRAKGGEKDSYLSLLSEMANEAEFSDSRTVRKAGIIAERFVALVLAATFATAVFWYLRAPEHALVITLSMLAVTCPCALSLAIPIAMTVARTWLQNNGILIINGNYLEKLKSVDQVVFDKTGSLTEGQFSIFQTIIFGEKPENHYLGIARAMERFSEHPLAKAFLGDDDKSVPSYSASEVTVIVNSGIRGSVEGESYIAGSGQFVKDSLGLPLPDIDNPGGYTEIYLANNHEIVACFLLQDAIRSNTREVLDELATRGYTLHLLSGDGESPVLSTANRLGIRGQNIRYGCSPEQKLQYIRNLQEGGHKVLYVGDGINDAPVLAASDCSLTISNGTDLAKKHSDAVILHRNLAPLLFSFTAIDRTWQIIHQNLFWAISYNVLALPLAAAGMVPPWLAAIGMSASSLIVTLNSLRLNRKQQDPQKDSGFPMLPASLPEQS